MNKERGEVTIKAGDKTYTIRFPNKHLCALEDDMGMDIQGILKVFGGLPSMKHTRIIFRRGLVQHHGEIDLDDVSDIIDQTDYAGLVEGLLTSIAGAFPTITGGKKKKR